MTTPRPPGASGRYGWLALLYLASGAPYGLVSDAAPVLYRTGGVDLEQTGLLTLAGFPWVLKFLWAPLLDRYGSRRLWIVACQVVLGGLLLALSFLPSNEVSPAAWVCLIGLALFSATQDVAIDAYSIGVVPPDKVGPANGVRVTAYRIALVVAGGMLVGQADALGWAGVWRVAAGALLIFAILSLRLPPLARTRAEGVPLVEPIRRLAAGSGFLGVAAFVLVFKIGDYAMAPMTKPFLLDAKALGGDAFTKAEIGNLVTPIAIGATILGALVGGALTKRWGVFKSLWVLGLLQAVSNLAYAGAAASGGRPLLWAAAAVEPFCGGLGTAPFLSFLMLSCQKEHAGTQFALWTALMGLGRIGMGSLSGFGVKAYGYAPYFAATFLVALPAFLLLPYVRRWLAEREAAAASAAG